MCKATGSPELGNKICMHTDGKQQFRVKLVSRPGSELQTQTFQKFVHCCLDPALFLFWPLLSHLALPLHAFDTSWGSILAASLHLDCTSHGLEPNLKRLAEWLWITSIIFLLKSLPVQTDAVFQNAGECFLTGSVLSVLHTLGVCILMSDFVTGVCSTSARWFKPGKADLFGHPGRGRFSHLALLPPNYKCHSR